MKTGKYCEQCGSQLEKVEMGAENFQLPNPSGLPRIGYSMPYPKFDDVTGKRNVAQVMRCPKFNSFLSALFIGKSHDCFYTKIIKKTES